MEKGLLIVFTGNGKGKTTAALGQIFRAIGQGLRCCMIQFIKGSWHYGELDTAKRFAGELEWHVTGHGFTWESKDLAKDAEAARAGWALAREKIGSGRFSLVVLDELTYLVKYKLIDEAEIVSFLHTRPQGVHVIITGRDAPLALIEAADLVTRMDAVKHPYDKGRKAQRGIEF